MWRERFGGDPRALGKSVTLDGVDYTVVGIAPRDFRDVDVYIPLAQGDPLFNDRRFPGVFTIARLKPGVTMAQAHSEMSAIQANLDRQYPETDRGLAVHIDPLKVGLSSSATKSPAAMQSAYAQLLERIRAIPGVQSAGVTNLVPLSRFNNLAPFWIGSQANTPVAEAPRLLLYWTSPDYLRTMNIPLLQGRFITPEDTAKSEHVIVIDSVLAHAYFPGKNPIGQRVTINIWGDARIVGVAGHIRHSGLSDPATESQPQAYASLEQLQEEAIRTFYGELTTMVRTPLDPATVMPAVRAAVYGAGNDQPVYDVHTMREIVSQSMTSQRFPMLLLSAFAVLALLLASVGIYGVISYAMTQRVHEIGIRMALGAKKWSVFRMVLAQGLRLAAAGVLIGAVVALILARVVGGFSRLLYGVGAGDPLTFLTVSVVLIAVALLASYIPARRAMRTDPMIALRHE